MNYDSMKKLVTKTEHNTDDTLIITISEARKILGAEGSHLNDDELAIQIALLQELALEIIKYKHFAK